jgi:hypothetical protein
MKIPHPEDRSGDQESRSQLPLAMRRESRPCYHDPRQIDHLHHPYTQQIKLFNWREELEDLWSRRAPEDGSHIN